MMFAELTHIDVPFHPADGFSYIQYTFSKPVYVVLYVIWIAALWFHLSHGFWSAMQTVGINGKVWFNRWKTIGNIYVTLLMLGFLVVVLAFLVFCDFGAANIFPITTSINTNNNFFIKYFSCLNIMKLINNLLNLNFLN